MLIRLFNSVKNVDSVIHMFEKFYFYKQIRLKNIRLFSTAFQVIRCASSSKDANISNILNQRLSSSDGTIDGQNEFIPIFNNPSVKYLALINRTVWFPTVCVMGLYPVCSLLFIADFITQNNLISWLLLSTWTCGIIHVVALNIWRKVGFLYVNKDVTKLKVGFISYWGKRQDVVLPVNEVMPFSDLPKTPTSLFYTKVKTFHSKPFEFYKLDKHGTNISEPKLFQKVFGSDTL